MQDVDPAQAVVALSEAQKRAFEQRIAAERLLERARLLEERLSAEAEQARVASEYAQFRQLSAAAAAAEAAERDAAERAEACASALRELTAERERAERAERAALEEATAAEGLLRERRAARERLQAEARAAQVQVPSFSAGTPSLEAIDMLRELEMETGFNSEAARRLAERRAADDARRTSR
jgi:colicin import membrane protein